MEQEQSTHSNDGLVCDSNDSVCVCVWLVLHFGIVGVFFLKCLIIAFKCKELHMFLFFFNHLTDCCFRSTQVQFPSRGSGKVTFRHTLWDVSTDYVGFFCIFTYSKSSVAVFFFFSKCKKRGDACKYWTITLDAKDFSCDDGGDTGFKPL